LHVRHARVLGITARPEAVSAPLAAGACPSRGSFERGLRSGEDEMQTSYLRGVLFCLVAVMFTLIQTAKLNGIDPQAWLADVLARINDHNVQRLDQLLPWNWNAALRLAA
jgi:IS66 C-terminal element